MRGPSEVCGACGDHSRVAARENQVWEVLIWAMETRKQAGMLGALLNVASLLWGCAVRAYWERAVLAFQMMLFMAEKTASWADRRPWGRCGCCVMGDPFVGERDFRVQCAVMQPHVSHVAHGFVAVHASLPLSRAERADLSERLGSGVRWGDGGRHVHVCMGATPSAGPGVVHAQAAAGNAKFEGFLRAEAGEPDSERAGEDRVHMRRLAERAWGRCVRASAGP